MTKEQHFSWSFRPPDSFIPYRKEDTIRNNITILVADDDDGHFTLTKRLLRKASIANEIIWLPDGQATLDFLVLQAQRDKQAIEKDYLLLLDIRMPKLDGFEVLEKVRHLPDLKNICVVVITTSDFPDNIERCKELQCADYLIKPLTSDFIDILERICSKL